MREGEDPDVSEKQVSEENSKVETKENCTHRGYDLQNLSPLGWCLGGK